MPKTVVRPHKIEAGERMDTLVAVNVMGWRVIPGTNPLAFHDELGRIRTRDLTSFGSFMPSIEMNAAWEVVARMHREHGCSLMLEQVRDSNEFHGAPVGSFLALFQDFCTRGVGIAPDGPLAISRAALDAYCKGLPNPEAEDA